MARSRYITAAVCMVLIVAFFWVSESSDSECGNEINFNANLCGTESESDSDRGSRILTLTVATESGVLLKCDDLTRLKTVAKQPNVKYQSDEADSKETYVLVMVDPDAPKQDYYLHWMVSDIPYEAIKSGEIKGKVNMEYAPPTPPPYTGTHRYQFYLFKQKSPIKVPIKERGNFQFEKFVPTFNLCSNLVASFQYRAEGGYED